MTSGADRYLRHFSLWTDEEKRAYIAAQREWEGAQPEGRIAALVALCEELLEEVEEVATGKRPDLEDYRARLAALKGAG